MVVPKLPIVAPSLGNNRTVNPTVMSMLMDALNMDNFEDWWKHPKTMYIGRTNLPRLTALWGNGLRIAVGQYGPKGPYQEDIGAFGCNSTFILFCMYFGLINIWPEGLFVDKLESRKNGK